MGMLTWVIIGVVVLAIIGLGLSTFLSGVREGAEEVSRIPVLDEIGKATDAFMENRTETFDGDPEGSQ